LDQGHGAVVFHQTAATGGRASSIPKTWFQVFTRRGNRLGAIAADLLVSRAIATPTPYRFLALEQGVPEAVLLLDLKPFRARRIPLTMTPTCIQATSWGYLLAADDGELLLLNDDVEVVGRVAGPAHPTAIATFKPSGVLIATWDGQQGQLYTVDLRDLEIDLMF
jgi:serine/threonine-protein kinase